MATPLAPRALTAAQANQLQAALALLKAGRTDEALATARQLAFAAASAPDAQQCLAICLDAAGDPSAAASAFEAALALAPGHRLIQANYATLLGKVGNARRRNDDFESAEAAFRKAVELDPANAPAWINLGTVLRLLGRPEESISCFEQAERAGFTGPELGDSIAGVLLDVGKFEQAVEQARRGTRQFPGYAPGHATLAHLLWEYGSAGNPEDDPIAVFAAAVRERPQDSALRLGFASFLLSIKRAELVLEQLRILGEQAPAPTLVALAADALEMLGQTEAAGRRYAEACKGLAADPDFLNSYVRHLLRAGDWQAAAVRAGEATRLDPANQQAWAYLGTTWRLMDDPREFWLCDYERLIAMVEVEPPPGFASLGEFLAALKTTLEPMHRAKREPAHQSLRGGSQTPGRLFGRRDPVIEAARTSLLRAIEQRLAALPTDPKHPFLMRTSRSIRFSGSWSVRLWSSGSHVNHIHQQGWMSSAFYVSLPPSVRAQAADSHAGCIQFGQPPVELGLDLPPRRILRPEPGMLALFPSYMWHGTIPFEDDDARLTIAFDMTPSQESP